VVLSAGSWSQVRHFALSRTYPVLVFTCWTRYNNEPVLLNVGSFQLLFKALDVLQIASVFRAIRLTRLRCMAMRRTRFTLPAPSLSVFIHTAHVFAQKQPWRYLLLGVHRWHVEYIPRGSFFPRYQFRQAVFCQQQTSQGSHATHLIAEVN